MQPVLSFTIGGHPVAVASYSALLYLAAAVGFSLGAAIAVRRGLPLWRTLACMLAMVVAMPTGARLLDAATKADSYSQGLADLLSSDITGFSMLGGLLLVLLVGWVVCGLLSVDVRRLADSLTPALGVSIAIARIGCFLAGCCFGVATDLPWGVTFPVGSNAHLHQLVSGIGLFSGRVLPVHPTQLYEATGALIGAALAAWLLHRKTVDGTPFLAFIMWLSGVRWADYYLRVQAPTLVVPGWFYPALYWAIIVLCLWLLSRRYPLSTLIPSKSSRKEALLQTAQNSGDSSADHGIYAPSRSSSQ